MHQYLSSHIHEEIEGAIDYLQKAIELKSKAPDWAAKFYKMSEMEVEHANCMTKMFNSVDKPDDISDESFSAMQKKRALRFMCIVFRIWSGNGCVRIIIRLSEHSATILPTICRSRSTIRA